jgi:hypothetical protein
VALETGMRGAASALPLSGGLSRARPLVVVLSDLLTADVEGLGASFDALISQGASVAVVHILSPQEEAPTTRGELELVDAETGQRIDIGLSAETVERYRERLSAWLREVEAVCLQRGVPYTRVSSDQSVESVVIENLRRVQVVG